MDSRRRFQGTAAHRSLVSMHQVPSKSTLYDRDSGLVYSEFEVSGSGSRNGWILDYRTPSLVRNKPQPQTDTGARSLTHMALIKLGIESRNLTVEALQLLPWSIGERIWQQITKKLVCTYPRSTICTLTSVFSHAESFYIWRTFAIAFGSDFARSAHRYMLDIKAPSLPLLDYYSGLDSSKRDWLICLRISPKQVTVPDLVSLSTITNLTVLDLSDGQLYIENRESTFDFRIMRSWSELAQSGRAFQSLEVLMLGWQEKVDTWIFDLLDSFPRLNIVVMTDCRWINHKNHKEWEEHAWRYGWSFMPSKRGTKHLRLLLDDQSFCPASVSNMHEESVRIAAEATQKPADKFSHRPLLECWLGTPKPWRHVIDEFPGTRTVVFQKTQKTTDGTGSYKPASNNLDTTKHESSTPGTSGAKRSRILIATKRRAAKHSAASLLAEMN